VIGLYVIDGQFLKCTLEKQKQHRYKLEIKSIASKAMKYRHDMLKPCTDGSW